MTLDANGTLDAVTIGEAMAMIVAAEAGDLATVTRVTKRIAGA
ncbi:sugar kinase, partial [Erwinia amylovora]|nr:sugar kinase [Erwinia amylovora]